MSVLSAACYPEDHQTNAQEKVLHLGPPHPYVEGYSHGKRMLDVLSRLYRAQYGCNFITVILNNAYGPNDYFHPSDGRFIASAISSVHAAKISGAKEVIFYGDGRTRREFTFSVDVAAILQWALDRYDGVSPLNIGYEVSTDLRAVVDTIARELRFEGTIAWKGANTGECARSSCNAQLRQLGWRQPFTSLDDGLAVTCAWYLEHFPHVRGAGHGVGVPDPQSQGQNFGTQRERRLDDVLENSR